MLFLPKRTKGGGGGGGLGIYYLSIWVIELTFVPSFITFIVSSLLSPPLLPYSFWDKMPWRKFHLSLLAALYLLSFMLLLSSRRDEGGGSKMVEGE